MFEYFRRKQVDAAADERAHKRARFFHVMRDLTTTNHNMSSANIEILTTLLT